MTRHGQRRSFGNRLRAVLTFTGVMLCCAHSGCDVASRSRKLPQDCSREPNASAGRLVVIERVGFQKGVGAMKALLTLPPKTPQNIGDNHRPGCRIADLVTTHQKR